MYVALRVVTVATRAAVVQSSRAALEDSKVVAPSRQTLNSMVLSENLRVEAP